MKITIAGSTGVLGRRLVQRFAERGETVYGLVRSQDKARRVRALGGQPVLASVFDAEAIASATGPVDVVIHVATSIPTKTRTSPGDWVMNDRLRREGTEALTRYASRVGAGQYVQESITWLARPADGSSYDETTTPHPPTLLQSALDGERIALEAGARAGFRTAVMRFGYFYGADATHTRDFGKALLARKLPIIGRGDAVHSNIHLDDAAGAIVHAVSLNVSGLWHVVDDEPISAAALFNLIAQKLGAPAPRHVPVWLARLIAGRSPVEMLTISSATSNALFKSDTSWTPTYPSVSAGLDQVVSTWREEGWPIVMHPRPSTLRAA
jgi:nucleoside-diphosphate-sugar epimerase